MTTTFQLTTGTLLGSVLASASCQTCLFFAELNPFTDTELREQQIYIMEICRALEVVEIFW